MLLLEWFKLRQKEADFICERAAELRKRYGDAAELWCDEHMATARERLERRTLRQLRKTLRHTR